MSKMLCVCGAIISDVVCPCPTEGWLFGDHGWYEFMEKLADEITEFHRAIKSGRRAEWITQNFGSQYPHDITNSEVISD